MGVQDKKNEWGDIPDSGFDKRQNTKTISVLFTPTPLRLRVKFFLAKVQKREEKSRKCQHGNCSHTETSLYPSQYFRNLAAKDNPST